MAELTDNGIGLSTDTMIDTDDYRHEAEDGHLVLVEERENNIVFSDTAGHELNEWAEHLDMERADLSSRMHDLARDLSDYNWSTSDPVVIAK